MGDGPDQLNQTGKEKQKDETVEHDGFRVDQVNFAEQVDMPDGDSGQGADNDQEGDQHMDQGASTSGFREFHGQPPVAVR
jgi:hypothetical protein